MPRWEAFTGCIEPCGPSPGDAKTTSRLSFLEVIMGTSTFGGPMRIGDTAEGTLINVGTPLLSQATTLTQNSTTAVSGTLYLPTAAIIVDIIVDVLVAF